MKRFKHSFAGSLLLVLVLLVGNLWAVDDETCLGCHDGYNETLMKTPHQLSSEIAKPNTEVSCISCHSNGDVHADDPSVDNIGNPANLTGIEAIENCTSCHQAHIALDDFGFDAHTMAQLNCSSCHKVHGSSPKLLLDDNAKFCVSCHFDIKTDFSKRSNHPLNQGNLSCLSCHQFAKRTDDNFAYDMTRICQDCHPGEAGPHMYEHDAVNSYAVGGSGCVECHNPHGSENDRLLAQPVNSLCESCHLVPTHQTAHPGQNYDRLNCVVCHTTPHGSFESNQFLDPNLPAKLGSNCYASGCHSLVR